MCGWLGQFVWVLGSGRGPPGPRLEPLVGAGGLSGAAGEVRVGHPWPTGAASLHFHRSRRGVPMSGLALVSHRRNRNSRSFSIHATRNVLGSS